MNFLPGTVSSSNGGKLEVAITAGGQVYADVANPPAAGSAVTVGARPEHLSLSRQNESLHDIPVQVHAVEHLGDISYIYVNLLGVGEAADPLVVRAEPENDWAAGQKAFLSITPSRMHLFNAEGKACR